MAREVGDVIHASEIVHKPAPATRNWPPWSLAVATWAVAAGLVWFFARASIRHPPHMVDLGVYRTAGLHVLGGKPIYARIPADQLASLGRSLLVFTYPPISAILAVPLALLSWHIAQLAWVPMVYGPLAITIWFAFRPLLARSGRYVAAAFGAIFIVCVFLWPLLQEIRFGQVDIGLAALCIADVASRKPRWPRGLLIGLATAIKLTPGVFIIYLLLTGRRRAAATSAVSAIGFTLAAWLVLPSASTYYWTQALFNTRRLGRPAQISDQSIRAMLLRGFAPGPVPTGLWLAMVAIVAVAGFAAARMASRRGNETAAIAIVGMLAILISPVSWIHHIVWVVVAIGAIVDDGRHSWRWLVAATAAEFFIFVDPYRKVRPWFEALAPHLVRQVIRDDFGIAAAVLIVVLAVLPSARRARSASPGAPVTADLSSPPLPPAEFAASYSMAPGGSAQAARLLPASRARPPDPP